MKTMISPSPEVSSIAVTMKIAPAHQEVFIFFPPKSLRIMNVLVIPTSLDKTFLSEK